MAQNLEKPKEPVGEAVQRETPLIDAEKRHAARIQETTTRLVALRARSMQLEVGNAHAMNAAMRSIEEVLGAPISPEDRQVIEQRSHEASIANERNSEQINNLERLQRIAGILAPSEFLAFERILGNSEGRPGQLFDPRGTFLHTTTDIGFDGMLRDGVISTESVSEGGVQRTPGASFTDGNFSEAVTFQLVYDNAPGGGKEKQLRSDDHSEALGGSTREDFVRYFWESHPDEARQYINGLVRKIPADRLREMDIPVDGAHTLAEAQRIGSYFVPSQKGDFGVTIVYDAAKNEDLGIKPQGTEGLQRYFEQKSFKPGGVPLAEARIIFVPEARMSRVRDQLAQRGLSHVEVRPSEELEARRMLQKVSKG